MFISSGCGMVVTLSPDGAGRFGDHGHVRGTRLDEPVTLSCDAEMPFGLEIDS
jgi:hypothetical protein